MGDAFVPRRGQFINFGTLINSYEVTSGGYFAPDRTPTRFVLEFNNGTPPLILNYNSIPDYSWSNYDRFKVYNFAGSGATATLYTRDGDLVISMNGTFTQFKRVSFYE